MAFHIDRGGLSAIREDGGLQRSSGCSSGAHGSTRSGQVDGSPVRCHRGHVACGDRGLRNGVRERHGRMGQQIDDCGDRVWISYRHPALPWRQNPRAERPAENRPELLVFRIALLLPPVVIGLLPFSVMGRPTTLLEFGSRFRIPITPVAAAITVALALSLVRQQFRWVPVAMFGFIIGFSSWTFAYTAIQQSRAISTLESSIKPYVEQADGYTVAVVPFNRFESELTANIASTWSVELEKRLWVVSEDPARIQFGDRSNCRPISAIDVQVRGLTRAGKLGKLLWVEAPAGKPVSIEPYCRPVN